MGPYKLQRCTQRVRRGYTERVRLTELRGSRRKQRRRVLLEALHSQDAVRSAMKQNTTRQRVYGCTDVRMYGSKRCKDAKTQRCKDAPKILD